MNRILISTAALLTASLCLGPLGCDSDSGSDGAQDTDANDTEVSGTTLGPGDGDSTPQAPADCSCYDPAVDELDANCVDIEEALPGCAFEEPLCAAISQTFDNKSSEPLGPPTPEGAVTCVVEALAQGQTPRFTKTGSDDFSGSTSEHIARGDGTYLRDSCFWEDIGGGQAVDIVVPADAEYFAACLEDHAGDELSMYTCLFDGLTVQDDGFPACG